MRVSGIAAVVYREFFFVLAVYVVREKRDGNRRKRFERWGYICGRFAR